MGIGRLLSGIGFAEDFHGLPAQACIGGFDSAGFEQWVELRYNPHRLSLNSYSLAAHLAGAEDSGFELWFRWYDEFACSRSDSDGSAKKEGS